MYTFKMKGYILHGWPEFELSKAERKGSGILGVWGFRGLGVLLSY